MMRGLKGVLLGDLDEVLAALSDFPDDEGTQGRPYTQRSVGHDFFVDG
jgi:hypothetical protein